MHRLAWLLLLLAVPAAAEPPREGGAPASIGAAPSLAADLLRRPDQAPLYESPVEPDSYLVGPGDRLRVDLWGMQELSQEVEVSAEGRVFVPRAGAFSAQGQTLSALRNTIKAGVHRIYPNLNINVGLVRPRSFMVYVTGAVAQPGPYPATALTRASALVPRAAPLPRASSRLVEVRRRGNAAKIIVDLDRIAMLGETRADPTLLEGDTIHVPLRDFEVEISGAVKRPGRYELVGTRDVHELLTLAGGLDPSASSSLPLRHTTRVAGDRQEVRSLPPARAEATVLHAGDRVHVPAIADRQRVVIVEGAIVGGHAAEEPELNVEMRARAKAVQRETSFRTPFVEGDGVRDLLIKAGGLQPWADGSAAYLLRTSAEGRQRRIPVDAVAISLGKAEEVPIQEGDSLVIPARRESIVVGGAVQHPGLYPYNRDLHPLEYIAFAGGATRSGIPGSATVVRRRGGTLRLKDVVTIEPGDIISVPERRLTSSEWVQITLILANLAVGTAALGLTLYNR